MRVRRLLPNAVLHSRAHLAAVGFVCIAASVAAPLTVLATTGSAAAQVERASAADPANIPALLRVTLASASTVTKGKPVTVSAQLTAGPLDLADKTLHFVRRTPGTTTWTTFATGTTDGSGWATATTAALTAPTEVGAYYADDLGVVRSNTPSAVVHTIDMARSVSAGVVQAGAAVTVAGRLLKDSAQGIASQPVKVWMRTSSTAAWGTPLSLQTNSSGVISLSRRFTRTTQIGIRFPGANGLAASPLAVATVTVKSATASASGFVFPFANPAQAQSVGAWTQDQGVDLAARGYACGANAILVAVGDGVVIQEGIQGFGPTAPVIRMTSGPFRGRNVYYGHTGHVYVPVGAHVRAGQRLAQIGCGSVGYSSAPHLEIGVGFAGGPPCCPGFGQTSGLMLRELTASLRAALA